LSGWPVALPLIHRLDGFDGQQNQWLQRARALIRYPVGAIGTNLIVKRVDVRVDRLVVHRVDGIDQLLQMQLNAAALAKRRTGRPARHALDAPRTNVPPNFIHVFSEFLWGHGGAPFEMHAGGQLVSNRGRKFHGAKKKPAREMNSSCRLSLALNWARPFTSRTFTLNYTAI
jgi:hypothetical protein